MIRNSDHPVVVNFWASWCAPCLHEIPWLEESVAQFKGDTVELILVSLDPPAVFPAGLNGFLRKKGYTARCYWLEARDRKQFYAQIQPDWDGGMPASLFINPARYYRRFFARQLTERQIVMEIKNMLGGPTRQ
jgi:thiol-disulfide isomerase/thioredoxin